MVDKITRDEITQLRAKFPIAAHSIRQGHSNKAKTKCQWFVYLDRIAIIDRLDEVFPGEWEYTMTEPILRETHYSAIGSLTIKGKSRQFNGTQSSDGFNSENDEKGCGTDVFRRTASMWGIGSYLWNAPNIWTVLPAKGDWDAQRKYEGEAKNVFNKWFGGVAGPVTHGNDDQPKTKSNPAQEQPEQAQGWSADTKMDFTTALSKRFPGVLNPQIFKGMGIKSFEELGTVSEAAAKVIAWMYDNEKPFVADVVQYVMGDGSPFLVFRADDNPGSGHVAVRAYGRSSTVKNEWLGEYAYAALGFDTINKTPNKWLPLKYSLTVHYEQKTKDDDSVYYVATALGHNIYDPATVEAEGELAY